MDVKKLYGRDVDTCRSCYYCKDSKCTKGIKDLSKEDHRLCSKWKYSTDSKMEENK